MEIYFDNAATTRVYDEAAELMVKVMTVDYGNPSSLHMKGVEAEKYIKYAKKVFAGIMKVDEKELIFTSGGTESNNMALAGAAAAACRRGRHIISTGIEHASVYNPLFDLEEKGYEVTYLPVDAQGMTDLEALRSAVRPDTILVSVMGVNNEIGTVQPIADIVKTVKAVNPQTLIHMDAIQTFGKMQVYPKRLGIDMLSISGHKFHGPKGIGLLWVRDKVRVIPQILGGGQQKGMRSGTENVPGIAGMARAAELEYEGLAEKIDRLYRLREDFIAKVSALEGTHVNGSLQRGDITSPASAGACAAPHIVSVSFDSIRAEVLLHTLEEHGIYVSSGSACSSNHPAISGTLKAIGVTGPHLDGTLRFSFCYDTTQDEIDECIRVLAQVLPVLRRFAPKRSGRR